MSIRQLRSTSATALLLVTAGCLGIGPCAMIPGGPIEGIPAEPPRSWEMLGHGTQCDLEVNPDTPKSVRIDCYEFEGQLYVHAHGGARIPRLWGEPWVAAVERDPDVRLGVYGELYDLRALPVTDPALRRRVLESRGFDPVPEGIQLFALGPRPPR